jgi:hypothetical protein
MSVIRIALFFTTSIGLLLCHACSEPSRDRPSLQAEPKLTSQVEASPVTQSPSQVLQVAILPKKYASKSKNGFCEFKINYPEITDLRDQAIRTNINQSIFDDLLKTDNPDCSDSADLTQLSKDESYSIDLNYEVTYNDNALLSVKFSGLAMPLRNGVIASAHPSKIYKSYNYDLVTGKLLNFGDLFNSDKDLIAKINQSLAKQYGGNLNVSCSEPNSISPGICKGDYEFYISGKNLVIFNIFDNFAAGSVEAEIELSELKESINPQSLLQKIVK